ncbi:MAG: GIY-YIG nuclease family protein [Chitinophagales bacterium]
MTRQIKTETLKIYYVYILKCSDNSYYTGVTNDIDRRLIEHQTGINPKAYTHNRRPVELVFHYQFNDINQAIAFEKQVKGWNRKKKEALINDKWELLPSLSECKNQTSHKNYLSGQRERSRRESEDN